MNNEHAYTQTEIDAEADILMERLGLPIDRQSDIWRSLCLGISKGIGMGIDAVSAMTERIVQEATKS